MAAYTLPNKVQPWIETPLTESAALSRAAGCRIFLKHDHLQPSGSFKSRGLGHYMLNSLSHSPNPSKVHFHCSSGGNAGLACVHAAHALGRPATVVVPTSTKPLMIAKLRAAGAEAVIQHGTGWTEADAYLRETVIPEARGRGEECVYVMPFDHPDIWEGHSTLVTEIKAQLPRGTRPAAIVCSSGGGGLFNGIVDGVEKVGWADGQTAVVVLGTEGADAMYQAAKTGEHVTIPAITSKATSLGARKVSDRSFQLLQYKKYIRAERLTDAEAAMGAWRLADDERIIVELACGVNVAMCYGGRLAKALGRTLGPDEIVIIELCGGSAVTVDMVAGWKSEYGLLSDEISTQEEKTVPSAVEGEHVANGA